MAQGRTTSRAGVDELEGAEPPVYRQQLPPRERTGGEPPKKMLAEDTPQRRDRKKIAEPLPKTGAVCAQRVRCGKRNCRCAGGNRHLAYYLFFRQGGRLRKRYVRAADVDRLRAHYAAKRRERVRARLTVRAALGEWREGWRKVDALVRLLREIENDG